jgi:hypothetical protein
VRKLAFVVVVAASLGGLFGGAAHAVWLESDREFYFIEPFWGVEQCASGSVYVSGRPAPEWAYPPWSSVTYGVRAHRTQGWWCASLMPLDWKQPGKVNARAQLFRQGAWCTSTGWRGSGYGVDNINVVHTQNVVWCGGAGYYDVIGEQLIEVNGPYRYNDQWWGSVLVFKQP